MPGINFSKFRRIRLAVALAITGVVVLGSVLVGFSLYRPAWLYEVTVDGDFVGYVQSSTGYHELLERIITEAREEWGCDLVINQNIEASKVFRWYQTNDEPLLHARIKDVTTYTTKGYAIMVNGEPVVILASLETASDLLEAVKASYTPENQKVMSVSFVDNITIQETSADPVDVSDYDTALQNLLQGGDKPITYVVSRGDTLGAIARSYRTTVEELRKANSLKNDTLKVGQVLNLQDASGQIRVRTVYEHSVTEVIPYSVQYRSNPDISVRADRVIQSGSNGSRQVSWQIELVNGQEVRRTALASRITSNPTPRIIMPGSGYWPSTPTTFLRFPMNTGWISGLFGDYRRRGPHLGVDIAAPRGTPIYAAADGVVRTRAWSSSGGLFVVLDHKDGYSTLYAHASSIPSWVQPGRQVVRGQVIAYVGSTGNSTGPHLHWEVRINGKHVNPLGLFR